MGAIVVSKKSRWKRFVEDSQAQVAMSALAGFVFGIWWFGNLFGFYSAWPALSGILCGIGAICTALWVQKNCKNSKVE